MFQIHNTNITEFIFTLTKFLKFCLFLIRVLLCYLIGSLYF
jgi:hypothetical protein